MLALLLAAAIAAPAVSPSPEALRLGEQLARAGTLGTLLPLMAAKESDELVAAHPELDADGRAALRRAAATALAAGERRIFAAEARVFADRLSIADMRKLVARNAESLARRYRAVVPATIAAAAAAIAGFDYKGDAWAAFCAEMPARCPAKP